MQDRNAVRSFRLCAGMILIAVFGLVLGCANGEFRPKDPFDRNLSLGESQHHYTVLMRWSEFQKAKAYMAEGDRDKFLADMKALKDARFTDYESEEVQADEKDMNKSTVHVTYTLYLPSSPYELQIEEVQEWSRQGAGNTWLVHSHFTDLPKMAAN